jgi:hypothetical protein
VDRIYRQDLSVLRDSLRRLGAIVAEVDRNLRYVWIDNPHPDFDATCVVGRRDDELIGAAEAEPITRLKQEAWRIQAPLGLTLQFRRSDGPRAYTLMAYPVVGEDGEMESILTVGFETKSS